MLMKKIMLTLVAVFVISMATTYAQSDTTTTAKQTTTMDQQVPKGYSAIKVDDVPSSLRTTLGGQEYLGWESGTVYQNRSSNQYLVRIGTGQDTKSYYFDNSGKRIKDPKVE
jgi:maltose-binding protein MalE